MDRMIHGTGKGQQDQVNEEAYAELDLFFQWPPISQNHCLDLIQYWGVSYPF